MTVEGEHKNGDVAKDAPWWIWVSAPLAIAIVLAAGIIWLIRLNSSPVAVQPAQATLPVPVPPQAVPAPVIQPVEAPPKPVVGFDRARDFDESIKAAELFEQLWFAANPKARNIVSFIDISGKDGHLIVNMKDAYFGTPRELRDELAQLVLTLWKDTKYVREQEWAAYIEIKGSNDRSETFR